MANFTKIVANALNVLNPDKSAGKILMVLNALGIGLAAAANTYAAATDKNTSAEDKKFLVPAGGVTGLANLGIYFGMTSKLISKLAGKEDDESALQSAAKTIKTKTTDSLADRVFNLMQDNGTYKDRVEHFVENKIAKESKKIKDINVLNNMKKTLKNDDGSLTNYAKQMFREDVRNGFSVVGAFIGAVVGCAVITPILRDVSAYAVQKIRESRNPSLKNKPYMPYFDISHVRTNKYSYGISHKPDNRPLSMTSYLNFTHGRTRV